MPGMDIGRAGAHGEEQGVFRIAEARAHLLLDEIQGDAVLLLQEQGQAVAGVEVFAAGRCRDDEAEGHGKAQAGHLAEIGALASEQVAIVLAALGKQVHALGHESLTPRRWQSRAVYPIAALRGVPLRGPGARWAAPAGGAPPGAVQSPLLISAALAFSMSTASLALSTSTASAAFL
jgi:hypothetical protein